MRSSRPSDKGEGEGGAIIPDLEISGGRPVSKKIACVASGSARFRRENWNESKKRNEGGGGGE